MQDLLIYGAGDLGREYAWFVEAINQVLPTWELRGFLDDGIPAGTRMDRWPVLGDISYLRQFNRNIFVVCAVAAPHVKEQIVERLSGLSTVRFPVLAHPSVIMAPDVTIGEGSVIGPGCVLSAQVSIGRHVIINQMSSVSHNACVGDFCMIGPANNLGGWVRVGKGVDAGIGCTFKMETNVGDYAILGAGAVVVKDIPPACTAVGVPARPIH